MKIALLFIASLALVVLGSEPLAIDRTFIDQLNAKPSSWVAGVNEYFEGMPLKEASRLMGFKRANRPALAPRTFPQNANINTTFDAREQWPNCTYIGTIQNQARCGSCWAFGCIEAVSDRFCVQQNELVLLSFMDLVTCDQNDDGCQGGDASTAWEFVQNNGIVTSQCDPYTIPTCPPAKQPCLNFVPTPKCDTTCNSTSKYPWKQDKHFVKQPYSLNSVEDMQTDLMTNGPIEACFNVYEDFLSYKSGVYVHKSGSYLGGHCVKMLGWGVEGGLPYWLIANSWTTTWGDNGFFKILRGKNECGIESDVVAGDTIKWTA
eukprot:TRINITY_DN1427_c0_g1_i1.p1 TRINITY_DN1427_c0_g1~~TRINITY_DN1427_c0_g1_i1.p1  ORF type:complete len:319 (+),score=58.83 TRINITY_DN1427_c0_g1_i1:190-1146(+)